VCTSCFVLNVWMRLKTRKFSPTSNARRCSSHKNPLKEGKEDLHACSRQSDGSITPNMNRWHSHPPCAFFKIVITLFVCLCTQRPGKFITPLPNSIPSLIVPRSIPPLISPDTERQRERERESKCSQSGDHP
jgi:hypothetical protein